MTFKNFVFLTLTATLVLQSAISYAGGKKCTEGVVQSLSAGRIDAGNHNRIKAYVGGKWLFIGTNSDLDNSSGNALLTLLLYSKSSGNPVELWDHEDNGACKSFDEVYVR